MQIANAMGPAIRWQLMSGSELYIAEKVGRKPDILNSSENTK